MNPRHTPPPLHWPLGRPPPLAALLVCLWLAGLALFVAWAWHLPLGTAARALLCLGTGGLHGALLWCGWRSVYVGLLRWDGQQWTLQGDEKNPAPQVVRLQVWMAGQRWMWMQAVPMAPGASWWRPAKTRCLLAVRGQRPGQWPQLRRAVYSRPPRAAVPGSAA